MMPFHEPNVNQTRNVIFQGKTIPQSELCDHGEYCVLVGYVHNRFQKRLNVKNLLFASTSTRYREFALLDVVNAENNNNSKSACVCDSLEEICFIFRSLHS